MALACVGAAMALLLYLVEKTPITVAIMVVCIGGLLIYPVFHFVPSRIPRVITLSGMFLVVGLFGRSIWPKKAQANVSQTDPIRPSNHACFYRNINPDPALVKSIDAEADAIFQKRRTNHPNESETASACFTEDEIRKKHNCNYEYVLYQTIAAAPPPNHTTGILIGRASHDNTFDKTKAYGDPAIDVEGSHNQFHDTKANEPTVTKHIISCDPKYQTSEDAKPPSK